MKTIRYYSVLFILFFTYVIAAQNIEIYVSDAGNFNNPPWKVLKFDENGENPETFIEDSIVWPQDIVFLEDQNVVLISNLKNVDGYISKHDINTGKFTGYFAQNISGPTRMKIGADSLLYVLQWSSTNNKILRYKLDGTFVDEFTNAGVSSSIGLDWDIDSNLYVSSYNGRFIQKFDTLGFDQGRFINSSLAGPTNIWFDDAGDLLVSDYNGGKIKRFNADGEYQGVFIDDLKYPEGVAFFPNGNILIGNGGTSSVKLFDPNGNFIEDFIPSGSGGLLTPNAVVIREVSTVFLHENVEPKKFIYPTVGRHFTLQKEYLNKTDRLEVYNASGKLVESKFQKETAYWNADFMPGGLYIILARSTSGKLKFQKVIVK